MTVFRQIGLVLWKNFTIRRRRWPRVIFEIFWPLCLFLILMWVRTRNLTTYYDECNIDPKYLGSTGFLPALQTYVCRWNSSCYNTPSQSNGWNSLMNESSFWSSLTNATQSISVLLNDAEFVTLTGVLLGQIDDLNRYNNIWNGTIKVNLTTNDFNQSIPNSIIENLFFNPLNLSNLHQQWLIERNNSLNHLNVILEIFFNSFLFNSSYSYRTAPAIQQAFCQDEQINQTFFIDSTQWSTTKDFLCVNLTDNDLKAFLIAVQTQLDQIFLVTLQPTFANLTTDLLQISQTFDALRQRIENLGISLSFSGLPSTLNLETLCGGRNDLSFVDTSSADATAKSEEISPGTPPQPQSRDANDQNLTIDWMTLADRLMSSNETQMCPQSYIVGSGTIKQTIMINRTCRCVVFDQMFTGNDFTKTLGKVLRPLLYGKILYYPSNVQYDLLIKKVNEIFESLDELVRFSRPLEIALRMLFQRMTTICNQLPVSLSFCQQLPNYQTPLAVATVLIEFIACSERNRFQRASSESSLVEQGQSNSLTDTFLAGIVFLDDPISSQQLPPHMRFKIRMALDLVDNTFRTEDKYFSYKPRAGGPTTTKYHTFGFIYLQNALERAIISAQTRMNISYGVQTQQMPYPCWINDKFVNSIRQMLPLFMVLSWIFTVSMNVKDIVYEKEKRLKEIMRIMGLNDSVHWLTWFILCTTVMMLTALLLVIILKYGKILQASNFLILLIFFVCYTFATINQCFFLSVFFNRANLAACGAGIIYFLLYLPYTLLLNYDLQTHTWHKIIACLSSTVAFGLGCDYIARFEGMAQGIQWSNINKGAQPNDNFTFLNCLIMMLVDSVIYMLLTLYIENVFPGEYGIPQPWYYPFSKTYWFGFDAKKIRQRTNQLGKNPTAQNVEEEEEDGVVQGEVGVEIQNLSKYYRNKRALKNLSVKFYRNMITAFLGRNGAGKSTTWSILTGLIPPSSGTAYIDGYDILTDIKVVRKKLGFAPQHNILFDRLTVKEHLEFFSALKGTPKKLIDDEATKMLADLTLEKKSSNYSSELSGGMKRKLSIAIAFVGNSSTVILDEPTAGVDPYARRAIWDLILKYKVGRTIVLSTHHLDEADLLSDRLAIISSGELKCVGTTMYLKHKYGEGYHLIVELESPADAAQRRVPVDPFILDPMNIELNTFDSKPATRFAQLTEFLKGFMSDIRVKESHGDQITYVILDDVEHTRVFPLMLTALDENQQKYRVKSYGLSNSSLEQVFLRVADEIKRPEDYQRLSCWKKCFRRLRECCGKKQAIEERELQDENQAVKTDLDDETPFQTQLTDEWSNRAGERYGPIGHLFFQILGLLIKRFHRTKRNIKGLIAEILLPILFILLAILVIKLVPSDKDPPPLILHPWYWGKPNYMFQSLSNQTTSIVSKAAQQTFTRSPSLGTRCISSSMLDPTTYPCDPGNAGFTSVSSSSEIMAALNAVNYFQTRLSPDCDCDHKMQTCPVGSGGPLPSYDSTETKDILYRLADYNINDWTLKTEYWEQYLMKRFGGIEFLTTSSLNSYDLVNTTLIDQLANLFTNQTNQSSMIINAQKIASLFRIYPPQVSIWYNNKGWPSSVAFLNIFNNALLRGLMLQQNPSASITDYGITAINHPLPQTELQLDSDLQSRVAIEMFTAICVIFALAFIPASFLVFLIDERVTTSKHLQFVSGVKGLTYWWSNFVWDLTNYCVSITLCILIFVAFGVEAYVYQINLLCLILLMFLYGFAIIPLMYPINYFFKTPSTGFVLVSCINIFIGLISTITTITLENFEEEPDLKHVNDILVQVFLIFPHYCLGRGLFDLSKNHALNVIQLKYIDGFVPVSPFRFDIVGRNLMALSIQGVVFFLLAILVQYRFFIPDRGCIGTSRDEDSIGEDDDVAAERQRIYADRTNTSGDVLRMIDLVKIYGWRFGKKFTAVKRTCVGVKQGECFGLLGINGSGKSTTFKMLTGEISMTDGDAYVNNYSVIKQLDQVHENLGYCPQFDALDSLLTAREHLYLYARLRGIRYQNIPFIADSLLKRLGLTLWADRPVRQYSGGNKRKLSTAISLIGNPSIIFMDEPTTGMDVRAKRFLWNSILALTREDHKSVIITSHSMEECETLCNRLVIMVNGEFKCFGSVQHLKAKFGDGYTILVRTSIDSNTQNVIDYIRERLPQATIREEHNKMIHFRVSTNVPLHQMFSVLEKAREDLINIIEDYTVTQVTLDDVFVSFAKGHANNDEVSSAKPTGDPWWKRTIFCKLFFRHQKNTVELTRF